MHSCNFLTASRSILGRWRNGDREDPGSFSQIPSAAAVNQGKPGDSRVLFFPGPEDKCQRGSRGETLGDVGSGSLARRMHGASRR